MVRKEPALLAGRSSRSAVTGRRQRGGQSHGAMMPPLAAVTPVRTAAFLYRDTHPAELTRQVSTPPAPLGT